MPAPPNDRAFYSRREGSRSGEPPGRPLGAGSAEMTVEEIKDLVPSIDRLLGAVIRAIPGKESVAGAVVAVELVILAVLLQFRRGVVAMVGRRVGVFIPEQAQ